MPAKRYQEKARQGDCIQFTGSNQAEITAFCGQINVWPQDGTLRFGPTIVEATNWVLKNNLGGFGVTTDANFHDGFQEIGP
jgi:hypothetical protein